MKLARLTGACHELPECAESVQTDGHMKLARLTGACHEPATTFLSVQKVCRQMGAYTHLNVLTLHLY